MNINYKMCTNKIKKKIMDVESEKVSASIFI